MRFTRRGFFKGAGLVSGGAAVGAFAGGAAYAADHEMPLFDGRLPLHDGYGPAIGPSDAPGQGSVGIHWSVRTAQKRLALTFDDGPAPHWTPRIHDILDEKRIPATFMMVGEQVKRYGGLIADRMAGHEAANHTWSHHDLGLADYPTARGALLRTHHQIQDTLGVTPRLLRPPYGHLGGAALRAAGSLGYDIALWSLEVREIKYAHDPAALAAYIVRSVTPGTILLCHDLDDDGHRLVTVKALPAIIDGLQAKGYEFQTVSDLLTAPAPPPANTNPAAQPTPR